MYCDVPQTTADEYESLASSLLKLRYLGKPRIAVRGTISRNLYHFSDLLPVQMVDKRDARYLLASMLFGIAQ